MEKNNKVANKKSLSGVVKSDKMDKTIVVKIQIRKKHPLYGKVVNKSIHVKAHDEKNECKKGDFVRVNECRPISKDKRWKLDAILERAK